MSGWVCFSRFTKSKEILCGGFNLIKGFGMLRRNIRIYYDDLVVGCHVSNPKCLRYCDGRQVGETSFIELR